MFRRTNNTKSPTFVLQGGMKVVAHITFPAVFLATVEDDLVVIEEDPTVLLYVQEDEKDDSMKGRGEIVDRMIELKNELNVKTAAATAQLEESSPPLFLKDLQGALKKFRTADFTPLWTVLRRVFDDLGDGFKGLGKSALEFDFETAKVGLQERVQQELNARSLPPVARENGSPSEVAEPSIK